MGLGWLLCPSQSFPGAPWVREGDLADAGSHQIIHNCPDPGQSHSLPRALGSGGSCEALALWGLRAPMGATRELSHGPLVKAEGCRGTKGRAAADISFRRPEPPARAAAWPPAASLDSDSCRVWPPGLDFLNPAAVVAVAWSAKSLAEAKQAAGGTQGWHCNRPVQAVLCSHLKKKKKSSSKEHI